MKPALPVQYRCTRRDFIRSTVLAGAGSVLAVRVFAALDVPFAKRPASRVDGILLERVTLEMSLKPFRSLDDAAVRVVCATAFRQWEPLLRHAAACSVMLWTADGSEILDYAGRLDDEIEWAKYIGIANPSPQALKADPVGKSLHERPWLYMENPPRITYRSLRSIIATLKEVGRAMTGKPVTVGATFDPGPEFAPSAFKYERHPEIAVGHTMGANRWVACDAVLKADSRAYAGFPKGIPDGTTLGAFLGRQSRHFLKDLGFDYLWLSNGFGCSLSSWDVKGLLFDGKQFDAARAGKVREQILGFWRDFRRECPDAPIELRGSNLTTGADLASAASPLGDLYRGGFNLRPPPNSPWAALDGDFGLEIVGYLSHIAALPPEEKFPFRFYTHDPWWLNSPWLDRYGREPHDIYLPLAIARINAEARVTRPATMNLLTIDDSYGEMPEPVPVEVIPHVLAGLRDYSDEPGLVTWLCPFNEYHDMVFGGSPRLGEPFFDDWFLRSAVNAGFPLNSVVATDNFVRALRAKPDCFRHSVLLSRVPDAGSALESALLDCLQRGHNVFLYGPIAHAGPRWLDLLGLQLAPPLSGELTLQHALRADALQHGAFVAKLNHRELLSAGGVEAVGGREVCATVARGDTQRTYAAFAFGTGQLAWVRGSFCCSIGGGHLPSPDDPRKLFRAEWLMRWMLARFGASLRLTKPSLTTREPLVLVARHDNGFFLSGYCPSTTVKLHLKLPQGAPLLVGVETLLEDGHATYTMPRAWHREVRCFVEQTADGELSCVERYSGHVGISRRLWLRGLQDATVRFYPPASAGRVIMAANDLRPQNETSIPFEKLENGRCLVARHITGELLVSW